jgi:hypothetical protein
VAAAVPGATLLPDPAMGGAVELVLGADFPGDVRAVQPGDPAPGQPATPAPGEPGAAPVVVERISAADTSCA